MRVNFGTDENMNTASIHEFNIIAFKAQDNKSLCKKFIEGHKRVLLSVGVEEVSSSSEDWMNNPNVFVILCQSIDQKKVYGGVRIHIYDPEYPLPIVEATEDLDVTVASHVAKFEEFGTGEMCGLWNSIEVAGMGIGAVYLIRSAVAILPILGLKTLWALCSPFSARIAKNFSFLKYPKVGNNGTFYYPKIDLLATVCMVDDSATLSDGNPSEVKRIFNLRNDLSMVLNEENRGHLIKINFELNPFI